MAREIKETPEERLLHIQIRALDPKVGGSAMERAHVEVTIPFTRSDNPAEIQTQTAIYKLLDEGPTADGAQTLKEVLTDDQRDALAKVVETLVSQTKSRMGF